MSEYAIMQENVGRFTVKVLPDYDRDFEYALGDEPCILFGVDWGSLRQILDQSKRNFPSLEFMRHFEDGYTSECLNELCDMSYSDYGATESGSIRVEHVNWSKPRYFKTEEKALNALFFAEYGAKLSDLRVEQFGDYRSAFFLAFWQSELDQYAGGKNAVSQVKALQHVVDGEVYGFTVEDGDGDVVDSCWGFIGDESYCLSEGIDSAKYLESTAIEQEAKAVAQAIALARPDLAPCYV